MESVTNLSEIVLSKDEITILSWELKFCPTPAFLDPGEGRNDLDKLHRRLRLKSFFEDLPKNKNDTLIEGEKQRLRDDPIFTSRVAFKHNKFKKHKYLDGTNRAHTFRSLHS